MLSIRRKGDGEWNSSSIGAIRPACSVQPGNLGVVEVHGSHRVGIAQSDVEDIFLRAQQHSRGMRARSNRTVRFEQVNPTLDLAGCEVEFGDRGGVPKTAPRSCARFVRYDGVRKCAGYERATTQVEGLVDLAGVDIEQNDVV